MLDYRYNACAPGIKEKVVEMAINSSGIRETARVLKIDKNTVISILKRKEDSLVQVNPIFLSENTESPKVRDLYDLNYLSENYSHSFSEQQKEQLAEFAKNPDSLVSRYSQNHSEDK
ncbi:hypothetical protein BAZMOX_01011_2 [methanotrophic endosymbiont of Bathymodiolus azoricus (Menez Gwen)]|nr:hypothetical protein BAZMOX_01011_2 [methanotrophic endosymbiont of Bathymodiolus azoricus (Menez Gwen)]